MLTAQKKDQKCSKRYAFKPILIAAIVVAGAAVALWLPSNAVAEPVSLVEVPLEVQLMPEVQPGINGIVVGVRLPADTILPVTVRLPLPQGANVFWAGEILGGSAEEDIQREFTIVEGVGGQAVEFTAETTTSVQYDALYGAVSTSGNQSSTTLEWVQTVDTGPTIFGIRLQPGNELVSPESPSQPVMNQIGERLYALMPMDIAPGGESTIEVIYRASGDYVVGERQLPVRYFLFISLGIALLGLGLAIYAQRQRKVGSSE